MALKAPIAVFSKPGHPLVAPVGRTLADWLEARGEAVACDPPTAAALGRGDGVTDWQGCAPRLAVVLGGDGTLLRVARHLRGADVPLLGVNLGTLGFLTELTAADLPQGLEPILAGDYVRDRRGVVAAQVLRGGKAVARMDGLNEAVISKGAPARIIELELLVNDTPVSVLRADGLIVSTATGSTAYSLSAGGPVLHPALEAWVITPICPHTLSNRPLIVHDTAVIEARLRNAAEQTFLTLDGQEGVPLEAGDRVVCRKGEHDVTLVRQSRHSFFSVLRNKLNWA